MNIFHKVTSSDGLSLYIDDYVCALGCVSTFFLFRIVEIKYFLHEIVEGSITIFVDDLWVKFLEIKEIILKIKKH